MMSWSSEMEEERDELIEQVYIYINFFVNIL